MTVIAAATATGPATPATPTAPTARPDTFDKDAFLKLLVAQLRYQDPMNPAEGAEFIAQTAQFTAVERLDELAEQNAELLAGQHTMAASSLIGRQVSYVGADGMTRTATVTAVRFTGDGPVLAAGDDEVPLVLVQEVRSAAN